MAVENINPGAEPQQAAQRGTAFPAYDLEASIAVARTIHQQGGGRLTPEHLAHHLGYKGVNNGAYLTKVASARAFGLMTRSGAHYTPTPLAYRILSPVYPQDVTAAKVEAFMGVDLFRRLYEEFKNKELPPEFGMKNALRTIYGVNPTRLAECYRVFMESAETAGFFKLKGGARTHMIMPDVSGETPPAPPAPSPAPASGGASMPPAFGGGGGEPPAPSPSPAYAAPPAQTFGAGAGSAANPRDAYLNALVRLFEKKSAEGDIDEALMQRIERLLGMEGGK